MSTSQAQSQASPPAQLTTEESLQVGIRITLVGLFGNLFLVAIKLLVGFWGMSQALVADGVHSLTDLVSDFVVFFGLKLGRKEADEEHPYGHGRIETIATLIVGVILMFIGVGIAWHAIQSIYIHDDIRPSGWAIAIAGLSILLKEVMYRITVKAGRRIRSSALIANAMHHRSDAFSSIAVMVGIFAAWFNPDWHMADSLAALVVTYLIIRMGASLSKGALRELIDTVPEDGLINQISATAMAIEGVIEVHDIRARQSGPDIFAELHIVIDGNISVFDGHRIANTVEKRLLKDIEGAHRITIHVDPDVIGNPDDIGDPD